MQGVQLQKPSVFLQRPTLEVKNAKDNFHARAEESVLFAGKKWEAIKSECLALYDLSLAYHNDSRLDTINKGKRKKHLGNYILHDCAKNDFMTYTRKKLSTC